VSSALPKPVLAVAIGLPALLAVGVAALGLLGGATGQQQPSAPAVDRAGPLPLVPVDAPDSGSPDCATLIKAMPEQLTDGTAKLPRRQLMVPAPAATVAWGDAQHDPIVLRCGLGRPPEFVQSSQLLVASGVQWLPVTGDNGNTTWYLVDRGVYAALTAPENTGSGPGQEVSAAVGKALPPKPLSPNPG
jgi:Protein of unknown function (DUF3515)